jgi:hypothetical protein
MPEGKFLRVRTEKCESCLYALKYPKRTRERILSDVSQNGTAVKCHLHNLDAGVLCNGYWTTVGENGTDLIQIAIRLHRISEEEGVGGIVEWVTPEMYPRLEE